MENTGGVCPSLGLEQDSDSSHAFPSYANVCYRAAPIGAVTFQHQEAFCLSGKYAQCPVFLRRQATPLPDSIRAPRSRAKSRVISQRNIIAIAIALIAAFMLEWEFISRATEPIFSPATPTFSATLLPTVTLTPPPTFTLAALTVAATGTPTLHVPFFGSVTVTQAPTLTPGVTATQRATQHQLDTPIGTERKFIIHRLSAGEKIDPYALQFNTSVEAVKALNYDLFLKNPVRRDVLIVFPLRFTDVSGLPTFVIYQAQEAVRGLNYEELARRLRVNLDDFKYYNGIHEPGDRPLVGAYYLIPQRRLVP